MPPEEKMRLIKGGERESTRKKEIESCKNDRAEKNDFFTGMDYKLNKSLWSFGDRFQRNGSSFFLHRQISSALRPAIGGVFRRKDEEGLLFILNVVFSSSSPRGNYRSMWEGGGRSFASSSLAIKAGSGISPPV